MDETGPIPVAEAYAGFARLGDPQAVLDMADRCLALLLAYHHGDSEATAHLTDSFGSDMHLAVGGVAGICLAALADLIGRDRTAELLGLYRDRNTEIQEYGRRHREQ